MRPTGEGKIKASIFIAIALIALVGCAGHESQICKTVPEGQVSLICIAADELGTTPEDVAKVIQIANVGLIASGAVSADEILKFTKEAREAIETFRGLQKLTPDMALDFLYDRYKVLSMKAMMVIKIVDPFAYVEFEVPEIFSDFDLDLLIKCLDEVDKAVLPFAMIE